MYCKSVGINDTVAIHSCNMENKLCSINLIRLSDQFHTLEAKFTNNGTFYEKNDTSQLLNFELSLNLSNSSGY